MSEFICVMAAECTLDEFLEASSSLGIPLLLKSSFDFFDEASVEIEDPLDEETVIITEKDKRVYIRGSLSSFYPEPDYVCSLAKRLGRTVMGALGYSVSGTYLFTAACGDKLFRLFSQVEAGSPVFTKGDPLPTEKDKPLDFYNDGIL